MRASEISAGTHTSDILTEKNMSESHGFCRPRLTLRALNKLRKIRELRRLEVEKHKADIRNMYGTKPRRFDDKQRRKKPDRFRRKR